MSRLITPFFYERHMHLTSVLFESGTTYSMAEAEVQAVRYAELFWRVVWPRIRHDTIRVRVWFIRVTVTLADVKPALERIFGADMYADVAR